MGIVLPVGFFRGSKRAFLRRGNFSFFGGVGRGIFRLNFFPRQSEGTPFQVTVR